MLSELMINEEARHAALSRRSNWIKTGRGAPPDLNILTFLSEFT